VGEGLRERNAPVPSVGLLLLSYFRGGLWLGVEKAPVIVRVVGVILTVPRYPAELESRYGVFVGRRLFWDTGQGFSELIEHLYL
jgi:hypothetical protein